MGFGDKISNAAEDAKGKAKEKLGDAKDAVSDAVDNAKNDK